MHIFYDNIIFTQRQISTTLAEMSNLLLLWKLRKTLNRGPNCPNCGRVHKKVTVMSPLLVTYRSVV